MKTTTTTTINFDMLLPTKENTLLKLITAVEDAVSDLRLHLETEGLLPSTSVEEEAADPAIEQYERENRQLVFLKAFFDAGGRLSPSATSAAARKAGYHPSGTAGFYVGNGCLRMDGDDRVLTGVGYEWFRALEAKYASYEASSAEARP